MKTLLHDMEVREEGREEGRQEGLQNGKERVNHLIIKLTELNRTSDLVRAASDENYQDRLFKELGI